MILILFVVDLGPSQNLGPGLFTPVILNRKAFFFSVWVNFFSNHPDFTIHNLFPTWLEGAWISYLAILTLLSLVFWEILFYHPYFHILGLIPTWTESRTWEILSYNPNFTNLGLISTWIENRSWEILSFNPNFTNLDLISTWIERRSWEILFYYPKFTKSLVWFQSKLRVGPGKSYFTILTLLSLVKYSYLNWE